MAGRFEFITCLAIVFTVLVGAATAATHTVGDDSGWQIPRGGAVQYEAWAARTNIMLGDSLAFNWNGTHNVARVSKEDFDNCKLTKIVSSVQTSSPGTFTIINTDTQYFICTVDTHCSLGMKMAITAKNVGTSSSASASSPLKSALSVIFSGLALSILSHL